ncbi:hypothetical protein BGZ54_002106, partial [Gamsiella multidivaricata]
MAIHQKASSEAARIKRQGQRLIGEYIEHLVKKGLESLDAEDRKFLDIFCPRVSMKNVKDDADDTMEDDDDEDEIVGVVEEDDDEEEDGDEDDTDLEGSGKNDKEQRQFLSSLLTHLYSGNFPKSVGIGIKADAFISRLEGLDLYTPPRTRSEINKTLPFTPTDLVRSVVGQLKAELKRMYKKGTCDLHKT